MCGFNLRADEGKLSAFLATPLPIPRLRAALHIFKLRRCGPQWLAIGGSHVQARVGEWTRTARTAHRQQPIRQHKVAIAQRTGKPVRRTRTLLHISLCYHTLQIDNTYPPLSSRATIREQSQVRWRKWLNRLQSCLYNPFVERFAVLR